KQHEDWATGQFGNWVLFVSCILLLLTGSLAVFYAKSTGGLMGIIAGIGILLLYHKKTRWPSVILGVIAFTSLLSLPQLAGIKHEVFLGDRSGQIRVAIWKETVALLKDRPLLGAGLSSYDERIVPYHTTVNGEGIEIFHHPHNIFLTMWVNLGLLGLVGFIILIGGLYMNTWRTSPVLIAVLTTLLVTGLVDSPYIKNDLAVFFWIIPLLAIATSYGLLENKYT
ncbi:MAG: hypothetical protein COV60_00900, partial [Candidatus Magasanikbacteria bacterium CG11_big_fil_rev_8_21_14_0_20_43_7]